MPAVLTPAPLPAQAERTRVTHVEAVLGRLALPLRGPARHRPDARQLGDGSALGLVRRDQTAGVPGHLLPPPGEVRNPTTEHAAGLLVAFRAMPADVAPQFVEAQVHRLGPGVSLDHLAAGRLIGVDDGEGRAVVAHGFFSGYSTISTSRPSA